MKTKNILIAVLVIVVIIGRIALLEWWLVKQRHKLGTPIPRDLGYDYENEAFYKKVKYNADGGEFTIWFPGQPNATTTYALNNGEELKGYGATYTDNESKTTEEVMYYDMVGYYTKWTNGMDKLNKLLEDKLRVPGDATMVTKIDINDSTGKYMVSVWTDYVDEETSHPRKRTTEIRKYIGEKSMAVVRVTANTRDFPSREVSAFFGSFEKKDETPDEKRIRLKALALAQTVANKQAAYVFKNQDFYKKKRYYQPGSEFAIWFPGDAKTTMGGVHDSLHMKYRADFNDDESCTSENVKCFARGSADLDSFVQNDERINRQTIENIHGQVITTWIGRAHNADDDYTTFRATYMNTFDDGVTRRITWEQRKYLGPKTLFVVNTSALATDFPSPEVNAFLESVERLGVNKPTAKSNIDSSKISDYFK